MIYQLHDPSVASILFAGWPDTMVLSCLQGVMGRIYADSVDTPCCAMAILGDFCFLTGTPNRELVTFKPEYCTQDCIIMVPHNDAWARLIEDVYGDRAAKTTRYAIKKEGMIFDLCKLQSFIDALPQGYTLHQIDESLYHVCRSC